MLYIHWLFKNKNIDPGLDKLKKNVYKMLGFKGAGLP